MIGVLNKHLDVTDKGSYFGVVVNHSDSCLLCPHLQKRLNVRREGKRRKKEKAEFVDSLLLGYFNNEIQHVAVRLRLEQLSDAFTGWCLRMACPVWIYLRFQIEPNNCFGWNYTNAKQPDSLTWFFPFSVRILVTLPKGRPRAMTSVSEASFGSFLMWITREGRASSTLSFLLSLPLGAPSKISGEMLINWKVHYNDTLGS